MTDNRPFGDLLSHPLRSGVTVAAARRGTGIKMLNMGELFRYPQIPAVEMARVQIPIVDPERVLLEPGDLMFARRSLALEGAGKCSIVKEVDEPTTWESSIIRARLNQDVAHAPFYFYFFRSSMGRRTVEAIVEQVAAAGIRLSELRDLRVPVPDLGTQRAIAAVLGALDEKIAANTELASTADFWVRAVFDKVSRSQERIVLGRLITLVKDLVDPSLLPTGTVYVGLEHIRRRLMWLDSRGTAASVTSTKSRFTDGDILFGKLRPYFHKVASAPVGGVCSTDILVVRPVEERIAGFVLATVTSDEVVQHCVAASEGTRMPRTSWKDLAAAEVAWPGDGEAFALSENVSRVRDAVEARLRENETLAAIRDALLPELMSGKIRVKDAEKRVEEVL